jgi:hypothetical protein
MARGVASWGRGKLCSYKKLTIVICCVNLFVALVILRSLWCSLASNSFSGNKGENFEKKIEFLVADFQEVFNFFRFVLLILMCFQLIRSTLRGKLRG